MRHHPGNPRVSSASVSFPASTPHPPGNPSPTWVPVAMARPTTAATTAVRMVCVCACIFVVLGAGARLRCGIECKCEDRQSHLFIFAKPCEFVLSFFLPSRHCFNYLRPCAFFDSPKVCQTMRAQLEHPLPRADTSKARRARALPLHPPSPLPHPRL